MNVAEQNISKSSKAFGDYVWPIIKNVLGGGRIIPVEGMATNDMAQTLDRLSGIDAWQVVGNEEGIRGIASRVQPSGKCWGTFTIRRSIVSGNETEYHKRIRAIFYPDKGLLFPTITIQAYVNKDYQQPVYGVGVIKTKDLFLAALLHEWQTKTVQGGNSMIILPWDKLAKLGYPIRVINA
jgi:hypothetical protein